jgi:hypothetical protein
MAAAPQQRDSPALLYRRGAVENKEITAENAESAEKNHPGRQVEVFLCDLRVLCGEYFLSSHFRSQ